MGANLQVYTMPDMPETDLREHWAGMVARAVREDGANPYSGSIATTDGLTVIDKTAATRQNAIDLAERGTRKWGPACAMRYPENEETRWVVAALCAE